MLRYTTPSLLYSTLLDANWMRARPFAGIRTLQCILLKVALVLGVELHTGCEFVSLQFVEAACPCALRAQVRLLHVLYMYMYYVRVYEPRYEQCTRDAIRRDETLTFSSDMCRLSRRVLFGSVAFSVSFHSVRTERGASDELHMPSLRDI